MTVSDVHELSLYGGGALVLLMTLIQIAPVKFNPWTWLGRCIGRLLNAELLEEIQTLKHDVKNNKRDNDEEWASSRRSNILRFGDELRRGVCHSKEHFDQVLLEISKYENYCKAHPEFVNNRANATIIQIKKIYQECLEENKFL